MSKKIVAVNASPRKGWNTDTLVSEAARGAEAAGAEVTYVDLYKLGHFTGCLSCFGCKTEKNKGHCLIHDALSPVLEEIRQADGVILGSPNYIGELTSGFRALYERLVYPFMTYNKDTPSNNQDRTEILLIMTCNLPEDFYNAILEQYEQWLTSYVGDTEIFVCGDTKQIPDYGKTDWPWDIFDLPEKDERHEKVFPEERRKAYERGYALAERA